jgi:hypothetical protein
MSNGHDLIFAAGAPGSRWTRVLSLLSLHPAINNSDAANVKKQNFTRAVHHFGAYFGPYNEIGENFEDLSKLTKEEFLAEIKKPFSNWDTGVKIIKSHWFCHNKNLDWLVSNFPDASIMLFYNGDAASYKWWMYNGGFDITFPSYQWYQNDEYMYDVIQENNKTITDFARRHLIKFKFHENYDSLIKDLAFTDEIEYFDKLTQADYDLIYDIVKQADEFHSKASVSAIGIYNKNISTKFNSAEEFDHSLIKCAYQFQRQYEWSAVEQKIVDEFGIEKLEHYNRIIKEKHEN